MVEYDRTQEREHVSSSPVKICVVGIGGAGLNVLDRIALDRMVDATLIGMHTDVRVLTHAMTQHKLQLGTDIMRGIGSGGDPELGRSAAEDSAESIRSLLQGHEMVFICAGLGGGTGSGAATVVARIARECGALVFVFATTPFSFEGRRRLVQAEMALEQIQPHADALVLFENNRMGELVLPREGIQKAFSQADQLIGHSVRAISTMITQPGLVRLGLPDLISALRAPNTRCLFGFGEARGSNRVAEALKRAMKSPLIHQGHLLQQSKNLIVHVAGGESLTLAEVESLMKQLGKHVPDQTHILFGVSVDHKLGDSLALTLLSSLSAQQMACEICPAAEASNQEPAAEPVTNSQKHKASPTPEPKTEEIELPLVAAKITSVPEAKPAREEAVDAAKINKPIPVVVRQKHDVSNQPVAKPKPTAPVVEKAPLPAAKEPPPMPAPQNEEQPAPPKTSIFSVIEDEADEIEDEEPAPIPASAVVPRQQVRAETHPRPSAPVAPVAKAELELEPELAVAAPAARPAPVLAATGSTSPQQQPTLNLHQEEIARFKGTDKTIIEGEDLDVPTWMRMRQKTRR